MTFAAFMELALYHPEVGYYRKNRTRIGYGAGTDFYTASTSSPVFGELVQEAVIKLLREHGATPEEYTLVELGAERGASIFSATPGGFRRLQTIGVTDEVALSGRCVVFSNELFDAQPCARFRRTSDGWAEVMVTLKEGQLQETLAPAAETADLPAEAPEGYRFDAPRAAASLARTIARQPWTGLFIAFDYGKSLQELATETPQGTARAYFRHQQCTDLLARPGEQDLTCHPCWDWLTSALAAEAFTVAPVQAQETFLVQHAAAALQRMMTEDAATLAPRKRALLQLLHPAHLGRKFQVLSGWRD